MKYKRVLWNKAVFDNDPSLMKERREKIYREMQNVGREKDMKSLLQKGARSIFMTSEKNAFLCASLYMHASMRKLNIEFTISSFG